MSDVEVKFETKEVFAVRGFEARTRTKWENQGWEFVAEDKGSVRTKLSFRRPKPRLDWRIVGGIGAFVVVLIGFIGFMTSVEAGDSQEAGGTPETSQTEPASPVATPSSIPSTSSEPLTVENNAELAALLASEGDDISMNQAFFDKYRGVEIEFDGNIGYVANLEGNETLFDVLVLVDDYSETSAVGPMFRVLNVDYDDFKWTGDNIPDSITMGMNVRIVGKLVNWKDPTFTLEVISTEMR